MNEPVPAPPSVEEHLPKLNEWVVSLIRTYVPALIGVLFVWINNKSGLELSQYEVPAIAFVGATATAIWYGLFRVIELVARHPWVVKVAGFFLGSWKSPETRSKPATG